MKASALIVGLLAIVVIIGAVVLLTRRDSSDCEEQLQLTDAQRAATLQDIDITPIAGLETVEATAAAKLSEWLGTVVNSPEHLDAAKC